MKKYAGVDFDAIPDTEAAKKLAALVEEYSALEAGKVLDISLNAAKILNEEKDIDWAMAISAAQSIGIYDRG